MFHLCYFWDRHLASGDHNSDLSGVSIALTANIYCSELAGTLTNKRRRLAAIFTVDFTQICSGVTGICFYSLTQPYLMRLHDVAERFSYTTTSSSCF